MTDYRCDTGGCPKITYDGDTVTIVETANPGQVVVTSAASWDAYLDTIRAEERKRIVAGLRGNWSKIATIVGHTVDTGDVADFGPILASLIERGEIDDLVAVGDE